MAAAGWPSMEAFCEMDFDGGGWLAIYNFVYPGDSNTQAAQFHSSITTFGDMTQAVTPNDTSTMIHSTNIDLSQYSQVVFGYAVSPNDDVSRWGRDYNNANLLGYAYVDQYPGTGQYIGDLEISSGNTRSIFTGNNPNYPHVGMGFSGQIILWGFDHNASPYSHWGNWYDNNPCCNAGNDSSVIQSEWRYVIYIR